MTDRLPVSDDTTAEDAPAITVRYWGRARTAAGVETEVVHAADLEALLVEIDRRHRDSSQFRDVIGCCAVMVGEVPVGSRQPADVRLGAGDQVEILPPFAGGSQ